jgi:hypothetical protein
LDAPTSWFSDFVGVGYRYHDVYMNVFPLFSSRQEASKIWKKTIEWWPDDKIRLRFIEEDGYYWFVLYGGSDYTGDNTGFLKRVRISDNYVRFREGFEKMAVLRFGVYKPNPKKGTDGYDLELLKKNKSVYDLQFLKADELQRNSVEYNCIAGGLHEGG